MGNKINYKFKTMQNRLFLLCVGLIIVIGCQRSQVNAQSCNVDSDCRGTLRCLPFKQCEFEAPTQKVTTYDQTVGTCDDKGVSYSILKEAQAICTKVSACKGVACGKQGFQLCKKPINTNIS